MTSSQRAQRAHQVAACTVESPDSMRSHRPCRSAGAGASVALCRSVALNLFCGSRGSSNAYGPPADTCGVPEPEWTAARIRYAELKVSALQRQRQQRAQAVC